MELSYIGRPSAHTLQKKKKKKKGCPLAAYYYSIDDAVFLQGNASPLK